MPQRCWRVGDDYWALWIEGDHQRYFPVREGTVTRVESDVVRLSTGSWRYIDEGLPFLSRASAVAFIERHPGCDVDSLWRWADNRGASDESGLVSIDAPATGASVACAVVDSGLPTAWASATSRRWGDRVDIRANAASAVVAIGGSAGGITALRQLLPELRPGFAAFVIAMHLPVHHRAQLAAVLQCCTALRVISAESGMRLERDHIYTIPDSQNVSVCNGRLLFIGRSATPRGPRNIDHLFTSLAQESGPSATVALLSGTGRDGSAGLGAVRRAGGITFVQSPETALFGMMPRSAADAAQFSLDPVTLGRHLRAVLFSRDR